METNTPKPRDTDEHLIDLELRLLDPHERRGSLPQEVLADDFVEFGSSGRVYVKHEIVKALQHEDAIEVDASEFRVRWLGSEAAVLTYQTSRRSNPPVDANRCSIWQLRDDGHWQMVFHQGTPRTNDD